MAAAVVAVLAVIAVLMVLTAGLRTEPVGVSVTHGHIRAGQLLWNRSDYFIQHFMDKYDRCLTVYEAASFVDLWVSMNVVSANGGDGDGDHHNRYYYCNITGVRVFDMPNAPSFVGMVEIVSIPFPGIEICVAHAGALDRWIQVDNKESALDYLAKTYGGASEFTAMLQVNLTTMVAVAADRPDSTTATTSTAGNWTDYTYYCWPVTVGHSRSSTAAEAAVTCKPGHHIDYTAGAKSARDSAYDYTHNFSAAYGRGAPPAYGGRRYGSCRPPTEATRRKLLMHHA